MDLRRLYQILTQVAVGALVAWLFVLSLLLWRHVTMGPWPCP